MGHKTMPRIVRCIVTEYNKLTKRLLAEGYTAQNFPVDKVHIAHGGYTRNGNPLDNIYGGFEYNRIYCDTFIYKMGCGMHVKGINVLSNMGFMGEEWCHENDNPVIRCPYNISQCPHNDPRLHGECGGGLCIQCWCVCHRTYEPYDFERSFEKVEKERKAEMEIKYKAYFVSHNGRVCRNHMFYDERTRTWQQNYKPSRCAKMCSSQDGYCPILGRKLSKKRGNVYYDVKTSGQYKTGEQLTLLDGKEWVHIRKGIRFFDKPCSMDICEAFIKAQSADIERLYKDNHSVERMIDPSWQFEILNIRAESRPSRDLMQDLEDLKAGINITFDPESDKQEIKRKREKKAAAKQKRIEKLEKKILEIGYENLEVFSADKAHADKWLTIERIRELENLRQQKLKKRTKSNEYI